jgi:hypothetical protein
VDLRCLAGNAWAALVSLTLRNSDAADQPF